jgi:hypothetical protein
LAPDDMAAGPWNDAVFIPDHSPESTFGRGR